MLTKRTIRVSACSTVAALVVLGALGGTTSAKKGKTVAKVEWRHEVGHNGSTVFYRYKFRGHRRCLKSPKLTPRTVRFVISRAKMPPEAGGEDQYADDQFRYKPESKPFQLAHPRLGVHVFERPASATFSATNPNGTHGGTVSFDLWWRHTGHDLAYGGAEAKLGERLEVSTRTRRFTVKFKQGGVKRVIECVVSPYGDWVQTPPFPDTGSPYDDAPIPGMESIASKGW